MAVRQRVHCIVKSLLLCKLIIYKEMCYILENSAHVQQKNNPTIDFGPVNNSDSYICAGIRYKIKKYYSRRSFAPFVLLTELIIIKLSLGF